MKPILLNLKLSATLFIATTILTVAQGPPALGADDDAEAISSRPLPERVEKPGPLFERLPAEETGIDFKYFIDPDHPLRRIYAFMWSCGGAATGDINGDGKPDLFFAGTHFEHKLYLQTGDLKFTEVAQKAGLSSGGKWGAGVAMGDVDNDGDLDIYVTCYNQPNQLFINESKDGEVRFVEKAAEFGLDLSDGCSTPAFADYDRDGDLDVYVQTYHLEPEHGRPEHKLTLTVDGETGAVSLPEEWEPYYEGYIKEDGTITYSEEGRPDYLYRNNGDGTFTDVSEEAGITREGAYGLGVTWWDYDADGYPDIYISNDFADPDYLYHNNGNGTFTEVSKEMLPHTTWFSMGSGAADFNNDGLQDFLVADMMPPTHYKQKATMGEMGADFDAMLRAGGVRQVMQNALYINTGTDRFMEGARMAGISSTDWTWAVMPHDFDNDGKIDVFITNGASRNSSLSDSLQVNGAMLVGKTWWDYWKDLPKREDENMAFRNTGEFSFEKVAAEWGLNHVGVSYGSNVSDLDGDGDLDIVVVNLDEPPGIYRNNGSAEHRATFKLAGSESNRYGIGTSLELVTSQGRQLRQFWNTGGFQVSNEPIVHVGLGEAESIDELTVRWPSGTIQAFKDLPANHEFTLHEAGESPATPKDPPPAEPPMFAVKDYFQGVVMKELPYDDFAVQPLLPNQMSQLGPGQAWADLDGDGWEDIFMSGSRGLPTAVLSQSQQLNSLAPLFQQHAGPEDLGLLFFDVDSDGDEDLYVVSGGVEAPAGDPSYQDRLYINQGSGNLQPAPAGTLPEIRDSGSAVSAADFDGDGDLDLFVGGRVVPGQYPTTPRSYLLINEGGRLTDQSEELAPGLAKAGMVTSALWTDYDNDRDLDLLVTHDWGPVRVWQNSDGKLTDVSESAGTAKYLGWWNGITGGDIDNDGDIDYAVTNFGLNTKYHADPHHPELLFYGDMDGNGNSDIIEAKFIGDVCYPRRGFSCSSRAMPFLVNKIQTYDRFARSTLTELYGDDRLEQAQRFEANTLESGIFINNGEGGFFFKPFPRLAQISAGFGVTLTDVNYDGLKDCYIVQNFHRPQIETCPVDGGLSQLLLGTGDPETPFRAIWPKESGAIVPGDAMSLCATDFDDDNRVDFVVGINNGSPVPLINQIVNPDYFPMKINMSLLHPDKDPTGARVTIRCPDMPDQVTEIYRGGGYLSQGRPLVFAGVKRSAVGSQAELFIQWADGTQSEEKVPLGY